MSILPPLRLSNKLTIFLISVRAKIRDGIDGHYAFDDYWVRCLYEGEKGDPEDVEKGFLKSNLLVKVRTPPTALPIRKALIACQSDFPDDFYFALICTREPRRRRGSCASRETKKNPFETTTGRGATEDGRSGDTTCNCLYSCSSKPPSSRSHHSS